MKDFKVFESAIIGLLIGVVVSTYILFVSSTGRVAGALLEGISLTPLIKLIPKQYQDSLVTHFLFYVCVYIFYAIIVNLIFRIGKKSRVMTSIVIILLLIGVGFEQKKIYETPVLASIDESIQVETAQLASNQGNKKYFGEEAVGDLNNDTKDDIAFIIKRNDDDGRGDMFYVSASLQTNEGHNGTNLIFVGDKIQIQKISIEKSIIKIEYADILNTKSEDVPEAKTFYAQLINEKLKEVDAPVEIETATTTPLELLE